MKRTAAFLALLAMFLAAPALAKEKRHSEIFGSASWNDARNSEARDLQAAFTWEFPITHIFSLGPVGQYDYIRTEVAESTTAPLSKRQAPDPAVTSSKTKGNVTEVWSAGGRAVLHINSTHNGLYFAGEVTVPQQDADGYVFTPEGGYQWQVGGAILRIAYRHPFQQSNAGDTVDLERDQVTVGFGGRW